MKKKIIISIAIVICMLAAGIASAAVTEKTDLTKNNDEKIQTNLGLSIKPSSFPGSIIKALVDTGVFQFEAHGKGTYNGPLGEIEYKTIQWHFTDDDAKTIFRIFKIPIGRAPLLRNGEHAGSAIFVHGTASKDPDGTYHIEGKCFNAGAGWPIG